MWITALVTLNFIVNLFNSQLNHFYVSKKSYLLIVNSRKDPKVHH